VGDRKLQEQEIPEDPSTWCWTQADLLMLELIEEIHNRGMRVIFDGVFNHLGQDSPFFRDVLKNGKKSKYAKWFTITRYGKGVNPNQGGWRYKCWEGFLELPELRQDQNGIVAGPREYIFSAVDRWMKPQGAVKQGIDGWRLDVAPKVAIPFWQEFRQRVRAANPEAYIVGEVFGGLSSTAPFLQGDTFDAVMNYEYAEAVNWFFLEEKLSATTMDNKLAVIRNAYHPAITLAMQNLHGSHDTDRVLSRIQNRQKFKYRNWGQYGGLSRGENRRYNGNKPDQTGEKIYWLMTIFQITYPGCPMIYYGDEVGMWGANDPGCRKPMIWSEFEYQQEKTQPHKSSKRKNDEVIVNQEIYQWMKQLIAIRHQEVALQLGDYSFLEQIRRPRTLVFTRSYNQDTLLIIIHCGERNVTVRNIPKGQWMDLLSGKSFNTNNNACRLTSRSALILKKVDHEN
jgi:glycosidase